MNRDALTSAAVAAASLICGWVIVRATITPAPGAPDSAHEEKRAPLPPKQQNPKQQNTAHNTKRIHESRNETVLVPATKEPTRSVPHGANTLEIDRIAYLNCKGASASEDENCLRDRKLEAAIATELCSLEKCTGVEQQAPGEADVRINFNGAEPTITAFDDTRRPNPKLPPKWVLGCIRSSLRSLSPSGDDAPHISVRFRLNRSKAFTDPHPRRFCPTR